MYKNPTLESYYTNMECNVPPNNECPYKDKSWHSFVIHYSCFFCCDSIYYNTQMKKWYHCSTWSTYCMK